MATLHVRNVPEELYEALRVRAEQEGRSLGSETIAILEEALGRRARRGLRRRLRAGIAAAANPFQRFTGRARRVVTLAQEEARALKHNYIGTEHILLGLLREEEGLAARVLESLDITVEEVRAQVARIVGQGDEVTTGQIPFTPRAKKVLELALREALSLGHNYIGTEHILLGLVRENEGVAARILLDLDADAEKIRAAVLDMLAGAPAAGLMVDPAPAWEPDAHAKSEEYRVAALEGTADAWSETMNRLAGDGWQLVSVTPGDAEPRAIFRRPAS